jgi:hypothetical protein
MSTFAASTAGDWRAWLARNWQSEKEVWLVIHHSGSGTPGPRYHEAVEHALCYGWIDSHQRKHSAGSCILRFTPPQPAQHVEPGKPGPGRQDDRTAPDDRARPGPDRPGQGHRDSADPCLSEMAAGIRLASEANPYTNLGQVPPGPVEASRP